MRVIAPSLATPNASVHYYNGYKIRPPRNHPPKARGTQNLIDFFLIVCAIDPENFTQICTLLSYLFSSQTASTHYLIPSILGIIKVLCVL